MSLISRLTTYGYDSAKQRYQKPRDVPDVYIVPGWVYRALYRNKMNLDDLFDYTKARQFLSVDDMAEMVFLQRSFAVDGCLLSNNWEPCFMNGTPDRSKINQEFDTIQRIASDLITSNNVMAKLERPTTEASYDFIKANDRLIVVVREGFGITLQNPESKQEFVKNYMKELYAMAAVADVNKLEIFKLYLKTLSTS
jgi:hypothetical protein